MATLGRWREDGKELFFVSVSTESSMWSQSSQDRSSTMTHRSSSSRFARTCTPQRNSYIPSSDGKRFLVNMTVDSTAPPIHVIRNWTAGLKD